MKKLRHIANSMSSIRIVKLKEDLACLFVPEYIDSPIQSSLLTCMYRMANCEISTYIWLRKYTVYSGGTQNEERELVTERSSASSNEDSIIQTENTEKANYTQARKLKLRKGTQ
jgi:hypothetical protein